MSQDAESVDCDYCEDGWCVGCNGSGNHPYAGQGSARDRDYVPSAERCSWCGGSGFCSVGHLPKSEQVDGSES